MLRQICSGRKILTDLRARKCFGSHPPFVPLQNKQPQQDFRWPACVAAYQLQLNAQPPAYEAFGVMCARGKPMIPNRKAVARSGTAKHGIWWQSIGPAVIPRIAV